MSVRLVLSLGSDHSSGGTFPYSILFVTVILTTHDMHDIEAMTNRVILIGKGRTLFDGNVSLLKENYTTDQSIEEIIAQVYTEYEI